MSNTTTRTACLIAGIVMAQAGGAAPDAAGTGPALRFSDSAVAEQRARGRDTTDAHVGEDGIAYLRLGTADPRSSARADWLQGKVEPGVSVLAAKQAELDVIVYVTGDDTRAAGDIAVVKAWHMNGIGERREQIRAIERKYRPEYSMSQADEREYIANVARAMDVSDSEELERLRVEIDDLLSSMRAEIGQTIEQRAAQGRQSVQQAIVAAGGTLGATLPLTNAIAARIPAGALNALAAHASVASILEDRPTDLELNNSVASADYGEWWGNGLTGGAYDFGVVDTGVQQDHPAFSGISFYTNAGSSTDSDGHGTHVTGTVASSNGTYTGGAYGLDAIIWSSSCCSQSVVMDNMHWQAASAGQSPEVINHSLGYGTATTDYNDNDSFYDAFVENFDVMVSKSAGNNGWSDSAPTITHPAPSYNILVVANMDDFDTLDRSDDRRSSSSSVGPTDGGRRKPDITAPGTDIVSTNASWSGGSTGQSDPNCWQSNSQRQGDDFMRCSGTSMAAPHVAAGVVLLEDGGNHLPMAQKAVLLNAADAWTSNDTSTTSDDGPVNGSLWDKSYGWGYLDMWEAHFNRGDYFVDSVVGQNDTSVADDYKLYKGYMFANEKATLVWQKRAGTYHAGDPASSWYGLSDLNLRLYDEADGANDAFDLDGNDNVHQVAASHNMDAVIKVYAWSNSFSGASEEEFALATEENFVEAAPPSFTRNYSRPNYVGPYQTFDVTVRIFNNGDVAAHSNSLELQNISGVSGGSTVSVPSIAGGGANSETVFTLTTNGPHEGTHWLPIDFASNSYLENYTYSTSDGVSIIVETTAPVGSCASVPAYDNGPSVAVGWSASDSQTGVEETYLYVKTPGSGSWLYTGLYSAGTSGTFSYTPGAGDGDYQFAVRSVDKGGNWEDFPASTECSTLFDSDAPSASVESPNILSGGTIPLTFAATDASPSSGIEFVDLWYRTDENAAFVYTGLFSYSDAGVENFSAPDGDGIYYFAARAKDNAQNVEIFPSSTETRTFYDTRSPTGSILIDRDAPTTIDLLVELTLDADDNLTGVEEMRLSNDKVIWTDWLRASSGYTDWDLSSFGGTRDPGSKSVYVQYRDGAGNESSVSVDLIELVADADTDRDGVPDSADNCTNVANADQRDTNGDGYGNICDPDLDNDGTVNFVDLGILKGLFFSSDADADLDGDGSVNFVDLGVLKSMMFMVPGPSGLAR